MSSLIFCPGCQQKLTLPEDFLGQRVQCPRCAVEFQAQASATPAMEVDPPAPPTVALLDGNIPQARPAPVPQTGYAHYKTVTRAPTTTDGPTLFCPECGTKYPRTDEACPQCGYRNFELLAERLGDGRRPRPRDLPHLNAWLAPVTAILLPLGVIFTLVGAIIMDEARRPGTPPFLFGFLLMSVGILTEPIALVFTMIWLYQAWRLVSLGDEEFSPGLTIGLLFVPFFNFYWIFRALLGLSSALERELKHIAPMRPASAGWAPGLIACILLLIPYLQPVAVCMFLAWLLIANNAARRLIRLHERAAREVADRGDKRNDGTADLDGAGPEYAARGGI